jgi:inward rectifier potassium channel
MSLDFRLTKPDLTKRTRIVPRRGQERVVRIGIGNSESFRDIYVFLLTVGWGWFLLGSGLLYLGINFVFAGLYVLQPGSISSAHHGDFADSFFFSVQTIATIGYGVMAPVTMYANILVTTETLVGMTLLALVTGLMFARFSRPTARVLFSDNMVVGTRNGRPALIFRMANRRSSQIVQAQVTLSFVRDEIDEDGETNRRFYDLTLVRSLTPIFALTFAVFHEIEESSPLHGVTPESLLASDTEFVATVSGVDETTMQNVNARHSWEATEVLWHHRFVDILGYLEDGRRAIDYTRFNDTEPLGRMQ